MNRRIEQILLAALLVHWPTLFAAEPAKPQHVTVGAIRWDAWYGPVDDVGRAVQKSLSPKQWQWRLPFFAEITRDGTVATGGDTDEAMSREIAYARTAKLDYWAFCAYAPESPMSLGLKRYLANPARDQVRFCMIGDVAHWRPENLDSEAARFAELMSRSNYQKVLDGRPLFYVLNLDLESNEKVWARAGGFGRAIVALRAVPWPFGRATRR